MSIEHISDTAKWVAVYRAMESERPDALFHDPFALRLAGVEGENIVDALPRGRQMAWAMIVRTALFDAFVKRAVNEDGVDTVVNLAAGLDARPWRLDLPSGLRWFDVDLPDILDHKLSILESETPRCRYEARRVDLTARDARRALLAELDADATKTLVLTEGLLVYLTREQVAALAADLRAAASFASWVIDIANPRLLELIGRTWGKEVERGNAPFRFAPEEGTAFFLGAGWTEAEYLSIGEEGRRLGREMRGAWLWRILGAFASAKKKEEIRRISGVARLVASSAREAPSVR
jgi:methyltransferase (TIGR00027 family)